MSVPLLTADEAVEVARGLASDLALGDADRDQHRLLGFDQVKSMAGSGLLAITVPTEFGGPDLPASVVAEVFRLIAWGDPNIAQIPHSHFVFLNQLRLNGGPVAQQHVYGEVLAGASVANAQSEFGTKHIRDIRTTLTPVAADEDGPVGVGAVNANVSQWSLNGEKFYCTGSLFADYLAVLTHLNADGPLHVAWIRADAPGVAIIDDWDAVGQRTTGSGTVRLDDVGVTSDWITEFATTFDAPSTYGAFAQLLHAAIDAGIARRGLDEAAEFVRTKTRPYPDAGVEAASQDPVTIRAFGEMELAVRGAEALVKVAGEALDAANRDLNDDTAAEASLAVAAARASTTQVSVEVTSRLFEVAGTRSALAGLNLDRHWRNARTHTLHDPAGWKIQHLGSWAVAGIRPPRHGQI